MSLRQRVGVVAAALVLGVACRASAERVDPATLYELSTEGSSTQVKAGEKGTWVLSIRTKPNAHVSDEAPLKIELSGKQVTVEKPKLTLKDSVAKKAPGEKYAQPRFEVPFTATSAGKGSVDADVVFFICTEQLCARQQRKLSVPVDAT